MIVLAEARSGPMTAQLDRHAGAGSGSVGGTCMPEVISVTPDNFDVVLADLPRMAVDENTHASMDYFRHKFN